MWALLAAILGGIGWFLYRRWRRSTPIDARLSMAYWRNSALVLALYLLSILLGAGVTRIMVGFSRGGSANLLMVAFFIVWVLYGAVWLIRFLPNTRSQPAWLLRSRGWLDAAALAALAALATGARML
jgi:hypothetical protein